MQLTIEDIKIVSTDDFVFDGKKYFEGYHEHVKQVVLDALTSQTKWYIIRPKIHNDVENIIGKRMTSSFYDSGKFWNCTRMHPDYTLLIKVEDILFIVFTPCVAI